MSVQTTYEFIVKPQGEVIADYMYARGRNTFLMGPLGSGKTYGSCMRIFDQMCEQEPNSHNVRKSRWIAIRNTYPDLAGTTIKDWSDLYHNEDCVLGKFNKDFPPTHYLDFDLPDGTRVKSELVFMALDRPDAVKKLRGTQVTGFWLNEMKELAKPIVDMCDGRHGRYPSAADGGPSWHGMIGDTNAPDDDHWYYELAEEKHPEDWLFLKQPGGVIEVVSGEGAGRVSRWVPNPDAENLCNLPDGYYIKQVQGKADDWIRINLANNYGTVATGMPIYKGHWNDAIHINPHKLLPLKKHGKLLMGFDFGRTPACIVGQLTPTGKLRVIREFISENMGIRSFMKDILPILRREYPQFKKADYEAYCDPSGLAKSGNDENSPIEILNIEFKIKAYGTTSNKPENRWESVNFFLDGDKGEAPPFEMSALCKSLRKGFNGGYQLRRIQVTGDARFTSVADKNKYSHCFVADTPVSCAGGNKRIADIRPGDYVNTPLGPRKVLAAMSSVVSELVEVVVSDGREIVCTPNHPFITRNGVLRADELQYMPLITEHEKVDSLWLGQQNIKLKSLTAKGTTRHQQGITGKTPSLAVRIFTETLGSRLTEQFLKGLKSIMTTRTREITELKTLGVYPRVNTHHFTERCLLVQKAQGFIWKALGRLQQSGTGLKLAESGIASTQAMLPPTGLTLNAPVIGAAKVTSLKLEALRKGFAECLVKVWQGKLQGLMTYCLSAVSALVSSAQTNTQKEKLALKVVQINQHQYQGTVKVYDLMVDDAECFYANGILVHNCHDALQYLAQGAQGEIDYEATDKIIQTASQTASADTTTGY